VPGVTCPACGAPNAADDSFCSKCGTPLSRPPPSGPPSGATAAPSHPTAPIWPTATPLHPGWGPSWGPPIPGTPTLPGQLAKPTAPFVLSLIGGILIVLASVFEIAVGAVISQVGFGVGGGTFFLSGLLGVVAGVIVLVFGILVYVQPQHHVAYGAIILVFSIVSLLSFFGGFVVGFILGLVGGVLAIAHKPESLPPPGFYPWPPTMLRVCPRCGRVIDPYVRFCPHCGNALG